MQVKATAPLILILAGLAVLPDGAASETAEFSGRAAVLRTGLEKFAHLQELCARQSDHPDCSPDGRMSACDELGEAAARAVRQAPRRRRSRAGAGQVSATSAEPSLLLHVSEMMHRGSCFEPAASAESAEEGAMEESIEDSVVRVARRSPRHLGAARVAFGARLRGESSGLRFRLSDVLHSVRFLETVNESPEAEFRGLEGEPLDAEEILGSLCQSLAEEGRALVDKFGRYEATFGTIPGAEYELQNLAATVFNRLESLLGAMRDREECTDRLTQAQDWWIAGRKVTFDSEPAQPEKAPNEKTGTPDAEGGAIGLLVLASAVEELEQECGEDCSDEARTSACKKLDPLVKQIASRLEATRRLSDRSRYHFVDERVAQAEMLGHLFIAGEAQRRLCDRDSDAYAWRDDYLRYEAEAVRLIDPALGAILARYLASRFDVDFRKGL